MALSQAAREKIGRSIRQLTPRMEQIVTMRFGIDEPRPFTLAEIGERFAVGKNRIYQIEKVAIDRLIRDPHLRGLLDDTPGEDDQTRMRSLLRELGSEK